MVDISDLAAMDHELLPAFETAFLQRQRQQQRLRFQYRDTKGVVTSRVVEPQAMLLLPSLITIVLKYNH